MTEMQIITLSKKGQIVLPKKVRDGLRIGQGSKLLLIEREGKVTLTKLDNLLKKKVSTLLLSEKSLAKDWLLPEEDEAWNNL